MSPEKCVKCGEPASGYAKINNLRYCHGDDLAISCYQLAQWAEQSEAWLEWTEEEDA